MTEKWHDDLELTNGNAKGKAITPTATNEFDSIATLGKETKEAVTPDQRTLEQKLADGETITSISKHRFNNEPLQLKVAFEQNTLQSEFSRNLHLFLAENDIHSLPEQKDQRATRSQTSPGNLANLQLSFAGKNGNSFTFKVQNIL